MPACLCSRHYTLTIHCLRPVLCLVHNEILGQYSAISLRMQGAGSKRCSAIRQDGSSGDYPWLQDNRVGAKIQTIAFS